MAENPLRNVTRVNQIKASNDDVKQSITLYDVDYAIMTYLEDVVLPTLDVNGRAQKIPVIYGNSERWNGSQKQGVLRDAAGIIQLPIFMIRRTSVTKNDAMSMLNRHVSYQAIQKYSKNNRYDRFSLLGSKTSPKYEIFNITMPDYVEITYECMGWTNFVQELNTITEALTFASEEYWGDKKKYKFNTIVTDYNIVNEVSETKERINRLECNLSVKAYLLPEKFDGESTTKKSINTRKIVMTTEVDLTSQGGRLEEFLSNPSPYYDNKVAIDFLALNTNRTEIPTSNNTITFTGIKPINTPPQLVSAITGTFNIGSTLYDIKLFINGVQYYQTTHFTTSYNQSTGDLTINFLPISLGFDVDNGDEVILAGKFVNL
jgi:hypothetical protein